MRTTDIPNIQAYLNGISDACQFYLPNMDRWDVLNISMQLAEKRQLGQALATFRQSLWSIWRIQNPDFKFKPYQRKALEGWGVEG